MKLSEIVTEQQLDELDVAGGVAKGLGAVSRGAGAVGGAAVGAWDAAKQGFAAGRAAVGGYKAKQPPVGNAGTAAPADGADSTLKVNQILKLVGELAPSAVPAVTAALKQNEPQPAAAAAAPQAAQTPATAAPAAAPQAAPATPNPSTVAAQTRTGKQAVAAKAAQAQMKANPVAPKTAPQTPGQIRAAKQATAGQAAQDQMAANAKPAAPKGNYDGNTGEPISDKGKADAASTAAFNASPKGQALKAKWDAEDSATSAKPAASFNNQLAGGKQTVSTGSKFDPSTMQNTPGTPVGDKVQGGVPATGTAPPKDAAPAPAADPGAAAFGNMASQLGKGNEKNYQATLDKNIAAQKVAAEPTANLAQEPAPAAPAGNRPQGGGKVAGQLSDNPRAVKRRNQRQANADWSRMATGTEGVEYGIRESRSIFTK